MPIYKPVNLINFILLHVPMCKIENGSEWKTKENEHKNINEVTCSLFCNPVSTVNAKPVLATMSNKTRPDVFRTSGSLSLVSLSTPKVWGFFVI